MALFSKKKTKKDEPVQEEKTEKNPAEVNPGEGGVALPKGGDAHSYRVILSPHITEKGTLMSEQNKYIFKIADDANKTEVKKAVESLYKVKVAKTHIAYAKSKFRQVGRYQGRKAGFKKAIVTLKEGSKIDVVA